MEGASTSMIYNIHIITHNYVYFQVFTVPSDFPGTKTLQMKNNVDFDGTMSLDQPFFGSHFAGQALRRNIFCSD